MRLAVPLALDPRALAGLDRSARVAELAGETMGTIWRVRLALPPGDDPAALRSAIAARLAGIVAELSQWVPTSRLSRFNRADAGAWMPLPPDFAAVMAAGLDIAARSAGAFDPTLGRLVDLWGFGATPRTQAPGRADLQAALDASGWRKLAFDGAAGHLRQPGGLWLDLSGIAKGHAVDMVADLLAAAGVRHCLVEIGGECAGRGLRPDGDPWWVDLETPPGIHLPPLRVALHQLAVATSGDYVRGGHTLDPASGRPIANGITAVSVLHPVAMIADAWASALTVLGPARAATVARREALAVRLIVRDGAAVREWISPALEQML